MSRFSNWGTVATWISTAGKAAACTREVEAIRATTALRMKVENFMFERGFFLLLFLGLKGILLDLGEGRRWMVVMVERMSCEQ